MVRLKTTKDNKTGRITFRCKVKEENKIKQKANIYCEGNISEYILYAALNFVPGKEDFEIEVKKGKRK